MKKHKCKDCIHCCIEQKKCYPQSKDCHSEYDLTEDDIYNKDERCDFFLKPKKIPCVVKGTAYESFEKSEDRRQSHGVALTTKEILRWRNKTRRLIVR